MRWFKCQVSGAVVLVAAILGASPARADGALFTPDCTSDNLLARKPPAQRQDLRGNFWQVTDEAVAPEGAQWDSPVAVLFDTPAGSVTYDLGQPTSVSAFFVQADANDTYKIFGSVDGTPDSYKLLVEVETANGHGLRARTPTINPTTVRYLRIGEGLGDGFYSLSEFAAYCRAPTPFPPQFRRVDAPPARLPDIPWWKMTWWDNDVSARFEMMLALGGLALIAWGIALAKKNMPDYQHKLRRGLMIALGVLSFGAYWNFGFFHFRNYIHIWDTYHYYIGSKYFPELSYDRLYECVSVADSEVPSLRRRVELRKIMDLHTNMMGPTTDILAHPERCKQHFTPQRWAQFTRDVAYFREAHGVKRWEEAQTDHGYNATPVWNVLGTTLANLAPASDTQINALSLLDPAYAIGMMVMIWWAFGWRVLAVGLAVFATNFPSRFYWTGGAFLRWDWLFYMVGGVCLVRKERYLLGGFFLSYATLLRIFPLFLFFGPIMLLVQQYLKTRKLDRRLRQLVLGAALGVAVLFPLSLIKSGGISSWVHFKQNSEKHTSTPLTNYMGLRTLVAYAPSEAGRFLRSDKMDDPWHDWKLAKLKTFRERRALFVVLALGFAALLWYAVRGAEPWVACCLSATMIAVGVELTCYYYSFLIVVALLYDKRKEAGAALLAVTAATSFIDWAPTRFLPDTGIWRWLKMPTWLDEQYMWMGIATLVAFGWILYRFGFVAEADAAGAAAVADGGGAPAAASAAPPAAAPSASPKRTPDKVRRGPRRHFKGGGRKR
ncbi:MAG TPA: hypothetical protein VFH68_08725 [Polyangia bacterium]|jgi:hypothetical protein|nr:hypothetical protein [Polyangia bacterium]